MHVTATCHFANGNWAVWMKCPECATAVHLSRLPAARRGHTVAQVLDAHAEVCIGSSAPWPWKSEA